MGKHKNEFEMKPILNGNNVLMYEVTSIPVGGAKSNVELKSKKKQGFFNKKISVGVRTKHQ